MTKTKSFETALKELEDVVKEMESGELSLEESLRKYETGIKQSRYCLDLLDTIEKKISILTKDADGKIQEKPFEDA
ncbi:MAG: exodeoxyribonuclease VII small subunit [Proteobacteria bacterium]|nr:exodeoxyribonuclease VII small subunit [Pseudomonadota bacterium]MBU1388274.1 exodeoxyribonuclease VII small subunit [Pseudomonadota bacterium]MBU1544673.1 exodeoxyribonuclease VII small subunit [Pseudomonadota bacterium]MBU2429895.1 exodeoxyribonuclease VII small subunit [Pseudomonadota bacterium]MBU2481773.1 exodeoxyribonuclease VII small subunit [Pseudomonadota bacterium]